MGKGSAAPKHCRGEKDFTLCILEWAIQDRLAYLDAWSGVSGPEADTLRNETSEVIGVLRVRIRMIRGDFKTGAKDHPKPKETIDLSAPEFHRPLALPPEAP